MTRFVTFLSHPMPHDCGDHRHRVLWPARALGALTPTLAIRMSHPHFLDAALHSELLILNMLGEPLHRDIIRYRRHFGKPTLFEINDDFESFADNSQMADFYGDPNTRSRIREFAGLCDGVQFSSPFLAEKYADLNPVRRVFMNQSWESPVVPERRPSPLARLGWTASVGHLEDARELAVLLQTVFDQNPALRRPIHLMMDDELVRCFREAGLEVVRAPTGDFAAYLAFIGGIDLGLAHLMDSDFAQGRSDGKYLEYAARGVVALCKNGGTFRHTIRHGDNGFLYENAQDLAAILQGLTDRPERLAEVRAGALADLREVRNHTVAAQERLAWYREFAPELGTEGARFHLAEDPIEDRFFQLMTAHSEDPEAYADALSRGYLGLTETHPDFYRPWSLLGDLVRRQGGGQRADLLQKFATRIMQKSFNRAWGTVSVAELISSP